MDSVDPGATPARLKYPAASVLARALKRDFGIITGRVYRVQRGVANITPPSVSVIGYAATDAADIRQATALADSMRAVGYELEQSEWIIYVQRVPTKAEAAERKPGENGEA